jgi:hypothetical protein
VPIRGDDPVGVEEGLPAPPANLAERELPIAEEAEALGPWVRMHDARHDPVFFGRTGRNRFDDPEGEYGVLYAAEDAFGAFLETFGRRPGRNVVSREKLAARPLAGIEADRPLRLVDLTGPGLARIGATGSISTDAREKAQAWSRALYGHPSAPEGIRYRLRHDPSRIGVAIFERAGELRAGPVGTLLASEHEKLLAEILKEYRFGLVGGAAPF